MRDYTTLLDPTLLTDENAVNTALRNVEQTVSATTCVEIVEQLLSAKQSHSIALFLSGINPTFPIESWVMNGIAFDAGDCTGSTGARLLLHLSNFCMFYLLLQEHREITLRLGNYYRDVQATFSAIQVLSSFPTSRRGSIFRDDRIPSRKGGLRSDNSNNTTALLIDLGVPMPTDPNEAESALAAVLSRQRCLLNVSEPSAAGLRTPQIYPKCYLQVIRLPEIKCEIKALFRSADQTEVISNLTVSSAETEKCQTLSKVALSENELQCPIISQSFEAVDSFGEWPILISSRVDSDLRESRRRDRKNFLVILKKIRDLSKGDFSGDNQRRINGSGNIVPIFEAKATFHCRLVYQIDCLPEAANKEKQAIRIFGVYSHTERKTQLWDAIGKQLASKGKEYKNRCIHRVQVHSDQRHFLPAVFPPIREKPVDESFIPDLLRIVNDHELQTILILQKFVPFSRALLNSIFADLDAVFPFEVSLEEKSIIEHPLSCYVLGRSGTGKTTAMLHKMLWIEKSFQINGDGAIKARQMFVTKSGVLAEKVQEYFNKMLESLGMSNRSAQELKAIAEDRKRKQRNGDLVDKDEDYDLNTTLPTRFSDLRDDHFPLFITFDQLCALLEADLRKYDNGTPGNGQSRTTWKIPLPQKNHVSYTKFLNSYWCHFNQSLVKGLDPYSVFSELLGVIEGSEMTISSSQMFLDANTYESLSERANPTFSTKRSVIYDIFRSYHKMKRENGDLDAADRTHSLLHALRVHGVLGRKLDYLYVDEAQDNLTIDALLLRTLCHNPNGLFWAGDTAQTISSGCSFRFQDLKSMLYRVEKQLLEKNSESKSELPKTFYLTVNYRSHAGIVNCAHSIVELVQQYWPYSIDALAPEKGLIVGAPPVFLAGENSDDIQFEQFLFGARGDPLEFGAHQSIIVRDDGARNRLREKVGDIGIILTIYESKGLEFNDVLLYNFFEDSILGISQWRLILKEEDTLDHAIPRFNPVKHVGLCAELKSLYVAITRAKKNLWIVDCSEKGTPMKDYWCQRKLITVHVYGEDLPRLAETSTHEQWADVGRELFKRKQYSQAHSCFQRAFLPHEGAIAHAYTLRERAAKLPTSRSGTTVETIRRDVYEQAAEAFIHCASEGDLVYFRRSGECFEAAGKYLQAAHAYYRGKNFTESALLFRKVGKFDEAVAILLEKEREVQPEVVNNIKNAAKLFYLSRAEPDAEMLKKARQLFDTDDELLEYSEGMCLDSARAAILLSLGRSVEAVDCLAADGRFTDAIKLLLGAHDPDSTRRACSYILQGLWKAMPFGCCVGNVKKPAMELLALSRKLRKSYLRQNECVEVDMFHAIFTDDCTALRQLGGELFNMGNIAASALCFERLYNGRLPSFHTMSLRELAESLQVFWMYVRSMSTLAFQTDPRNSSAALQLFSLEIQEQNLFFVPKDTFFHVYLVENKSCDARWTEEGAIVTGERLVELYQGSLKEYLKRLLLEENESCLKSGALYPCIHFVVKRNCKRGDCTRDHKELPNYDASWYNGRIHVHLVQIGILQTLTSLLDYREVNHHRRVWVSRFYGAFHPPLYLLGSVAEFDPSVIPDFSESIQRLNTWTRELLYDLSSHPPQNFITNLLSYLNLSLSFDGAYTPSYIYHAKFLGFPLIHDYFRSDGTYVISEVINSLVNESPWHSLTQGIHFCKHVVDKYLPVDMSVLCDFLDLLCGQSIISSSRRWHKGVLHDALLPRSWWIKLVVRTRHNTNRSIQLVRLLFDMILSLLSQVLGDSKTEHFLFRAYPYWVYVVRLCRTVCLLGHNLKWAWAKTKILDTFRQFSSSAVPMCKLYFGSHSWTGIVMALHAGSYGLEREELLLVCHRHMDAWATDTRQERYYRRVNYTNDHDLQVALLQPEVQQVTSRELEKTEDYSTGVMLDGVNSVSMSQKHGSGQLQDAADDSDSISPHRGPETREDVQVHDVDEESGDRYDPSQSAALQFAILTEAEREAGNIIQSAYRKHSRTKNIRINASAQLIRTIFLDYLKHSQTLGWPKRSYYRLLYLGPLPHMLACLESLWMDVMRRKANAKKMLKKGLGHEEIDRAGAILTEIQTDTKELSKLRKTLGPKGDIHSDRNHEMLKVHIQDAVTFVQKFPKIAKGEMGRELEMAIKGILKEKVEKEKRKPELCVEDELDACDLY
ncbi:hypothetical protein AX15_005672 [Amanita polypyramis BW_CC]|nr:hypothetical protein AX15_005672 [Amanita polypyramis BW_CC]